MKVLIVYIMCMISLIELNAQSSVLYEYDQAGNRVGIVIRPTKIKMMDLDPNYVIRNCQNFEVTVICTDDNNRVQKAIDDINFEISLYNGYGSLYPVPCSGTIQAGHSSASISITITADQAHSLNLNNIYKLKVSAIGFDDYISDDISVYRYADAPSVQICDINASNIGQNSMQLSWNEEDGYAHIVLADSTHTPFPLPEDGHSYGQFNNDNINFITRNKICSSCSAKVIYNGTSNSIFVQGLYPNRTYRIRVYKYNMNCMAETIKYNMSEANNNPNQFTTLLKSSESENEYVNKYEIVALSPNPASEYIKIEVNFIINGISWIEIYNEIGEKVFQNEYMAKYGKNTFEINLKENNINRGSYYLKIIDAQSKSVETSFIVK